MKATELRIGNLIHYTTTEGSIEVTTKTLLYFSSVYHKPIKLTEQWLEDFGFVEDGNNWYWKECFGMAYEPPPGDYWVWQMLYEGGVEIQDFKYVHQLQNLYFALTGKELTK